jgi:hypothetical protein
MNPGRTIPRRRDAVALPIIVVLLAALGSSAAHGVGYTDEFRLRDCSWSSKGSTNPYFNLRPGYQLVLEGEDDGESARVEITVLRQTRRITFEVDGAPLTVRARVVEERESVDGELEEVSRNFFARCRHTSDVFYFGEEVDLYEDGQIVGTEGAWIAGEDGAMPGLIMPGTFLLGAKYFQEIAPEAEALDRGRHVEMGIEIPTPAGTFTDCVGVVDSTPLDPEEMDAKVYCPRIGLVMDEDLVLIEYGNATP